MRHTRGFVLIGVVMFVLALTILGLSLFTLSSYEAQFLGHSSNNLQAFYDALGGIDRARFMLVTRDSFSSVKDGLPHYDGIDGVVNVRARFFDDPIDTITALLSQAAGRSIEIRVQAIRNGVSNIVEERFQPRPQIDNYKRLITAVGKLAFSTALEDTTNRRGTYLSGEAWLNNTDNSSWFLPTPIGSLPDPIKFGGVPQPDIEPGSSYWETGWAGATTVLQGTGTGYHYNLPGNPGRVTYYKTAVGSDEMSIVHGYDKPQIDVSGYAVWMLDKGINFSYGVTVNGTKNDCLIIVARKGTHHSDPEAAIWFFGGLISPDVPVILIADGRVRIEQAGNGATSFEQTSYLSIFTGGDVFAIGPQSQKMVLNHNPADDLSPHNIIDILYSKNALPNPPATQLDHLTRIAGTWRQVTESNPD